MTPMEHAKRAYRNDAREYLGRPFEAAITAFLDAVLEDNEVMERISYNRMIGYGQLSSAIEALKQEALK